MPDHIRQPQNAMGPRSPAGSDSPLSLVISGRSRSDRDELAIHHKTPPPVPIFATVHHQHLNHGSSSGFSEEGESPNESPQHRIHDQDQNEQPLSLVVPKKNYDSGHDSEEASRSPNLQSIDQGNFFINLQCWKVTKNVSFFLQPKKLSRSKISQNSEASKMLVKKFLKPPSIIF